MSTGAGPAGESWTPDRRTLEWAAGNLGEDYIYEAIRDQVRAAARSGSFDFPYAPDAFWLAVAEASIETVLFELSDRAASPRRVPKAAD